MIKSPSLAFKNQKYLKKPSHKQSNNTKNKSLSSSILSVKSTNRDNGIKLNDAYYNDRRQIYLKQSRTLS